MASISPPLLLFPPNPRTSPRTTPITSNPIKLLRCPSRLPLRFAPRTLRCFAEKQSAEKFEQLFSNLNQATMKHEPGSVTSGIFLVAGTTVGAGILAIPAVTQEAGFLASALTCILCWIYMVVTGLLIAEVNVNTMCELGSGGVSLVSMAMRTIGRVGVQAAWYVLKLKVLIKNWHTANSFACAHNNTADGRVLPYFHWFWEAYATLEARDLSVWSMDFWYSASSSLSHLFWGWQVVTCNGILFFKLILRPYHKNVVPVLCTNLEGNLSKVRTAIVCGTAIPLILFLSWDAVILGTIPYLEASNSHITDPLELLRSNNGTIGPIVETFSFLAIATSYIGFVLGLSDFVADLLKLPSGQSKPQPFLLTLVPPLVLSLLDPEIFFKALDFAGTYGVLVLFGVLPAAMSWSERYSNASESPKLPPLVPGGRFTLSCVMGGALLVIFSEIFKDVMHLQQLT
ncbi:uncharacterized protein [Typha angustifolia]|uniref:uncharacterized protein isoform X3 n=1 Tax=Typha angustifolia TaxID=59011 RepID=UPI003C2C4A1F